MYALSTAELNTLEVIANPERADSISRSHLEKLSRLDLIEPCPQGVCMTLKGKKILFGGRS